ncbi:cilia- and flagella-associated protein 418 isoform 1-T1 [Anomaloglossus baeobatrachus]|uniref:cilia- and flagella-associated protein 418 isoform X1 n=1 Tax=Anomaloglossus baeobatrachus TaxID=238106 RepID=UPI003F5025D9
MADDDLDLLLDEVESKYCHPGPRGAASTGGAARKDGERSKNPAAITAVDDENVDDLIEDILDVRFYEENKSQNIKSPREQSCKASRQQPNKKCCPVYLGGSLVPFGLGTSVSERACDQLRCTSCDFNIVTFDDYKWDASCDYLFFRYIHKTRYPSAKCKEQYARAQQTTDPDDPKERSTSLRLPVQLEVHPASHPPLRRGAAAVGLWQAFRLRTGRTTEERWRELMVLSGCQLRTRLWQGVRSIMAAETFLPSLFINLAEMSVE